MTVTGIDYLTGDDGIPVGDLRFIDKGGGDPPMFPDEPTDFATFASVFCRKYGVTDSGLPPVVVTDESLAVIRSFYDRTNGQINRVNSQQARNHGNSNST